MGAELVVATPTASDGVSACVPVFIFFQHLIVID